MNNIYEAYVVPFSILIPMTFGFLKYPLLYTPERIILFFLSLTAVINGIAVYLALNNIPNLIFFHLYTIFEFGIISWFYRSIFPNAANRLITTVIAAFTSFCIINLVFLQKQGVFNTYTRPIAALILICYAFYFFNETIQTKSLEKWTSGPLNWMNAAILLYYGCCFFIFIFLNSSLSASRRTTDLLWSFLDTVTMMENILFAVGFYLCRATRTISLRL